MTTSAAVVESGARLLDETRPGWDKTINIAQLDIAIGTKCILGQVFGGYWAGMKALKIEGNTMAYGFSGFVAGAADNYETLNSAWREEIARRRLAEMPQPVAATADRYC